MAVRPPVPIPFPTSSFPGANPQEGSGRLINCYFEPLGEGKGRGVWRRAAGLSQHATTTNGGYRGGLVVNNLSYETWNNTAGTVDGSGNVSTIGAFPGTKKVSLARNQASPSPDVVAVDLDNGAYVLGSANVVAAVATATVGGTTFNSGDTVNLIISNAALSALGEPFPVTVSHTLGAGESAATVAAALNTALNANTTLSGANISSTNASAVVTVSHRGGIGNQTALTYSTSGTGNETVTFNPSSGNLTGGSGTVGAFTGLPTVYNGQGNLPQPNSVCFQDGYFFFTTGANLVFATMLNSLLMSPLTQITVQAKSDVTLLRGIPFSGFLLLFTVGSCEVWQDAANPAPAFPYQRIGVLEFGLAQANAIAGWETGFSQLIWVAQDNGVHWMQPGILSEQKISPPDLDRLIEAEVRAGNTLEASCYIAGGKKFWTLSSPDWSWEFNLQTGKWNERQSLLSTGVFGRWRATGGHPAFGKWLMGDEQSGNLLYPDTANYSENGIVQLFRLESGPVKDFPNQIRIARADFDFDLGVGIATSANPNTVSPVVAVSVSKDGGNTWGNPLIRSLGVQAQTKNMRISVKNMGLSSPAGDRWRLDASDPVYVGFMGGTQSSDPRTPGA